jgi:hypothetical protein
MMLSLGSQVIWRALHIGSRERLRVRLRRVGDAKNGDTRDGAGDDLNIRILRSETKSFPEWAKPVGFLFLFLFLPV